MKIAITSTGKTLDSDVDLRFGRAKYFIIWDSETEEFEAVNNAQNLNAAQGAGVQSAMNVANKACNMVVSGHMGPKAFSTLKGAGIKVVSGVEGKVSDVIKLFKEGKLKDTDSPDVEGHW